MIKANKMGVEGLDEIYVMGLKAYHWVIELHICILIFPHTEIFAHFSYINEIFLKVSGEKLAMATVHFMRCLN